MKSIGSLLLIASCTILSAVIFSSGAFAAPSTPPPSRRILFVVTSHGELGTTGRKTGFYLPEVAHPYAVLAEKGYAIDIMSPKGGLAPVDGIDPKDAVSQAFLKDPAARSKIEHTLKPGDVDPARYAAIFFAGGHGTMWDFPYDARLANSPPPSPNRAGWWLRSVTARRASST